MNIQKLYRRSASLITTPGSEWGIIAGEDLTVREIKRKILLPYALVIGIFTFFGTLFSYLHSPIFTSFYLLINAAIEFIIVYLYTIFSSWILFKLAANIDEANSKRKVFTIVTYSNIPVYVLIAITKLLPTLMVILIASVYSVYLFWKGMPVVLKIPENRKRQFLALSVILNIMVYVILSQILTLLYSAITKEFTTFGS